jgi:hypothetical protein
VADITMQPCKEAVDRFEDSFSLRLEEHRQAIDRVVALLADGGPALEARRTRCEEFLTVLAKEHKKLIDAQTGTKCEKYSIQWRLYGPCTRALTFEFFCLDLLRRATSTAR